MLTVVMTLVSLGTIGLSLASFAEYRRAVSYLAEQQTEALMTASQLVQQSESMIGSSTQLLLAEDNFRRREAMFEIDDRQEWIGRLVDALARLRPTDEGGSEAIQLARQRLMANLEDVEPLVQERIELRRQVLDGNEEASLVRLQELEARIETVVSTNRSLAMDLAIAVGYHVSNIRAEIQQAASQIDRDIAHRERLLLICGALSVAMILVTVAYIRTVVRRVVALQQVISRERPLPEEIPVGGRDEIGWVARAIRDYVAKLQEHEHEILNMNRELDFLAHHDALTQLYNRHHFERTLNEVGARSGPQDLCMAMIDIDHFKLINDRYGHDAGDKALMQVAAILRETLPASAMLARYGGEEFAVVFMESDREGAAECLERTRRRVAASGVRLQDAHIDVTISIGLACSGQGDDTSACLNAADQALYRAKHLGRNRLEVALEREKVKQQ